MLELPIGRRDTTKILFYAESPVKYAMFRPLHERLKDDARIEVFFAGKLRGASSSKRMAQTLGVESARAVRRGLAVFRRFDLMVTADYDIWRPFEDPRFPIASTPKLQLFHGVSVRNGACQEKMQRFDQLFTIGPYIHRAFVRLGIFAEDDPKLHKIGMPKVDRLLDGTLDRSQVAADLGIDERLPTVTLAPTWIPRTPMNRYGLDLIRALGQGPWNLLIKLHDKFFDPRYNTVDWRRRVHPLERELPRVRLVRDFDAVPTLFATDVLISDVSSIANEFALLDRPLVYLGVEDEERLLKQYPQTDLDSWGQRAGDVVHSTAECVTAVERALAEPSRNQEIRRAMAADLFYNPGTATRAALAALYDILGLEPAPAGATHEVAAT